MTISTIKRDKDSKPQWAKYRLCALGNLYQHQWSKSDCFALVMSQFEICFLTALAIQKQCIPKTGDIAQVFCQAYLPPNKVYWTLCLSKLIKFSTHTTNGNETISLFAASLQSKRYAQTYHWSTLTFFFCWWKLQLAVVSLWILCFFFSFKFQNMEILFSKIGLK